MFMNRWLSQAEIVELNKLDAVEESLVFARLGVHCKSGAVDCFLEQDADEVIGRIRRPPKSGPWSFYEEQEENSMIAINQEMEPFERIALGIERLIEVLVPKEATSTSPTISMLMSPNAAKQMRVNEQTVMKWCREGRLSASKIGGKWLIPQESVDAFIRKCEVIHGRRGGK